jgi:hypothetical protein
VAEPAPGTLIPVQERAPLPPGVAKRFWSAATERFETAASGRLLERDLVIAGLPVRLSFAGPAMYDAVFPALEHLAAPAPASAEPPRRVLIWDTASTGVEPPEPVWRDHDLGPGAEVLSLSEGPIRAAHARWGRLLVYDPRSNTLVFHAPDARQMPWREYASPMRSGLHWLLTTPERRLIHGAAVGEGSRGLLITARGGRGKSTLAVACFQAGLDTAGDDLVVVTLEDSPRAHSIYATAKLDRRSIDLTAPDRDLITNPGFEHPEKAVVDLRSGPIVTDLPISAIVVPQVDGTPEPRLERISESEALRQIGPSSVVRMPRPRGAAFATAAALARSLPAWRLRLGHDLPASVSCLRQLLAREEPA